MSGKCKFSCISVPLQVRLLPIPVMHVEAFPVRRMKKPQILFGKLRRSYTTSNEIQQLETSQLNKSSRNNQGIHQVINDTDESLGTSTPAGAIINNLRHKGITLQRAQTAILVSDSKMFANASETKHNKEGRPENIFNLIEQTSHLPVRNLSNNFLNLSLQANGTTATVSPTPTEKLICGNIMCPFTLLEYPKGKTSNATVNVKAFNASGVLSNSLNNSLSQHKNNTASIIPNKRLLQQGANTKQITRSRANLTATGNAKLKPLRTTPNGKDYRHWKTYSESKIKLKEYQNPFVGYKWVRNQDPTIGHTLNNIKDRRDHQFTAWIQQRHFEPTPLMRYPETRLQIYNKDDSDLPDSPKIYGNIQSPHLYNSN